MVQEWFTATDGLKWICRFQTCSVESDAVREEVVAWLEGLQELEDAHEVEWELRDALWTQRELPSIYRAVVAGDQAGPLGALIIDGYLSHYRSDLSEQSDAVDRTITSLPMKDLLELALRDADCYVEACSRLSSEIERNLTLSESQIDFLTGVLLGEICRPKKKPGAKPNRFLLRDYRIRAAIALAERHGLLPTRNDASDGLAGIDYAAAWLRKEGLSPTSFPGVKKIWFRVARDSRPISDP
jgi:hypothetical protein